MVLHKPGALLGNVMLSDGWQRVSIGFLESKTEVEREFFGFVHDKDTTDHGHGRLRIVL